MILLKKTIILVAFLLFIISCDKENSVTDYRTFIKENEHTDFSIFRGWKFSYRAPCYLVEYSHLTTLADFSSGNYFSFSFAFEVSYFNSISIRSSEPSGYADLDKEEKIVQFCRIKNLTRSEFDTYILHLVREFVNLKIQGLVNMEINPSIYLFLNNNTTLATKLSLPPAPISNIHCNDFSGFTKIDDTWYVKIDSVPRKNSD